MIITIDGPSYSGKSTISEELSKKLNFFYLNSGFIYRGLTYALVYKFNYDKEKFKTLDLNHAIESFKNIEYIYEKNKVQIFHEKKNITNFLKETNLSELTSIVSTILEIRNLVNQYQFKLIENKNFIADGRDMAHIYQNANFKFFLTASAEIRAQRLIDFNKKKLNFETALNLIKNLDIRDKNREHSPLIKSKDAIEIDTSFLKQEEVLKKIIAYLN